MNKVFIFDVDGTLTPSRGRIDPQFLRWFYKFAQRNTVYLATGSDAPKTIEQVGEMLFNGVARSYNCSGNSVWEKGVNIYNNDWSLPEKPWKYLESKLMQSKFAPKTGWHFDVRPGLLNFSIVGRKATTVQRQMYVEWDEHTCEREELVREFNDLFTKEYNIVAQAGGETGIDINPVGMGKEQIVKDLNERDRIYFFGDRIRSGGNDHALAIAVANMPHGVIFGVENWQETYNILKSIEN
jgi:phosphomannomutase